MQGLYYKKLNQHKALCSFTLQIHTRLKGFAADLSEPWSDTAPPVWGRWTCRSCWVQWWWQSCCPRRCSYCSIQAAVQPLAPEWGDVPAWWPVCLWTLGALADTAEKKHNNNQKYLNFWHSNTATLYVLWVFGFFVTNIYSQQIVTQ